MQRALVFRKLSHPLRFFHSSFLSFSPINERLIEEDNIHDDDDTFVETQIKQKVSISRAKHRKPKFVDKIRVRTNGGRGGEGCVSFVTMAPGKHKPDGGHGGAGGNVWCVALDGVQSLSQASHHFNAEDGLNGSCKNIYSCNKNLKNINVYSSCLIY